METIMEHFKSLNYLAILVAGLASFAFGAIWYQPATLGTKWMNAHGISKDNAKPANMGKVMGIGFLTTMLTALGLALFISKWAGWKHGLAYGCLAGCFIVASNLWKHNNFLMKPATATIVDGAHDIITFTIMGTIIGAWA
jgi:hypothetical protein